MSAKINAYCGIILNFIEISAMTRGIVMIIISSHNNCYYVTARRSNADSILYCSHSCRSVPVLASFFKFTVFEDNERIFLCGASSKDSGKRITSINKIKDKKIYKEMIENLLKNKTLILT